MINYDEPYLCDEHDPPVWCYDYCPACADPEEYYGLEEDECQDQMPIKEVNT